MRSGTSGTEWIPSQLVTVLKSFGPVMRSQVVSFFFSDNWSEERGRVVPKDDGGAKPWTVLAKRQLGSKTDRIFMTKVLLRYRQQEEILALSDA